CPGVVLGYAARPKPAIEAGIAELAHCHSHRVADHMGAALIRFGKSRAHGVRSTRLLGSADLPSGLSAVEHRPADVVSQSLIIQDQLADRLRELVALPAALEPPGALTLA